MKNIIFTTTLFFLNLCATNAQDSITRLASQAKMESYYAQANAFLKTMPKHNNNDVYIGTSLGLTSMWTDVVKQWQIVKTCDCTGKVIRIDTSLIAMNIA